MVSFNRLQDQLEYAGVVSHYASDLWKIGKFFEQQLFWVVLEDATLEHGLPKHFSSWSWAAAGGSGVFFYSLPEE